MEWIIVTDSGCDLLPGELAPNVHLRRVPLSILLGEEEWVDGADMDRERFLTAMEAYKGKSSSGRNSPINPSMFWIPVLPERRSRCWFFALAS